jgi:hypothetical protein
MEFVARDEIKAIVKYALVPPMKERGYKKNAYTWHKQDAEVVKVLNVQLSQWNTSDEAQFTVNLGVYHAEFHALRGSAPPSKNLKEYECDVRLRIGDLMTGCDHWWCVASNKDNEEVAREFKDSIETRALPWLDGFGGLEDMLRFFVEKSMNFDAAVAAHLLSDARVESFLRAATQKTNEHFKGRVETWAREHGYAL